ncbi:hypothetical protein HRbin30_02091 [bacterium HR30]|nr:hypothetical protein HRbin30_02091 [bacterium HR30]
MAYEPTRVAVEVVSARPALLILNDTFYPGWRATVDGRSAPIYRANFLFRGVPVQPGDHQVVFEYVPWSFRIGAALSIIGMTGALFLGLWGSIDRPSDFSRRLGRTEP